MKSILITGSSSGIGRATVAYFSKKGWQVAATMRTPGQESEMRSWPGVKLYALNVTNEESIQQAIADVIKDFSQIDVICNNAGYGAIGIFEKATPQQIRQQFETNVFGCMNVIRAVLPHFRQRHSGTIINITSMGGQITFPIYSVYHGTKWAMEGFSESLWFELRPLGIRVKCVLPGAIKTDFYDRSQVLFQNPSIKDYDQYEAVTLANTQKTGADAPGPEVVAKAVFKAATDRNWKLRYPVGGMSPLLLKLRKLLPLGAFMKIVRTAVEKGIKS
jgi:NAD(P)-dependent dehydrogenase (short-subunit alcohol dehydrogenase family)